VSNKRCHRGLLVASDDAAVAQWPRSRCASFFRAPAGLDRDRELRLLALHARTRLVKGISDLGHVQRVRAMHEGPPRGRQFRIAIGTRAKPR
jgi:hypothetical protein